MNLFPKRKQELEGEPDRPEPARECDRASVYYEIPPGADPMICSLDSLHRIASEERATYAHRATWQNMFLERMLEFYPTLRDGYLRARDLDKMSKS